MGGGDQWARPNRLTGPARVCASASASAGGMMVLCSLYLMVPLLLFVSVSAPEWRIGRVFRVWLLKEVRMSV